ncbi:uncharacterized protein NECHADRAFT_85713 [Fusarium vanettenii 77-13-4]|uniref:DUF7730 domain-containing protein n=1 Tax=Fusarium vanettenii (strain ATCC MYA-4622 / CBS 123669 / FGSC 9596 / NRRL 45880 / 77-13-4) TaxID=660122 RepID=C7ZPG8_FUSV7|nr:uncharacterized protein NECHADRAFT_85713 [Fusarium vanettenii 77-13-4]EEU34144.1 predicted protein [Fusarium vanettenii 77-13-4]
MEDDDLVEMANGDLEFLQLLREAMPREASMSIQATQWTIDPQDSCPLFARFPFEIRQEIFSYALSEHDSHFDIHGQPRVGFPIPEPKWLVCDLPENTSKPMPEHSSLENIDLDYYSPREKPIRELFRECPFWLRPGTSATRFQHTSILRTCRRIFLEARDLLMKNATLRIFYDADLTNLRIDARPSVHSRQRMTRYTANRLTSLEVYYNQDLLETDFLERFDTNKNLLCVEDLRITLRKNDWRDGSETFGLQLTPYGDGRDDEDDDWQLMQDHMALEEEHRQGRAPIPPIPYTRRESNNGELTWGESLSMIPNLKRFTMDFEYSEDQFERLKELAEWAQRVWMFRLGGKMKGYYLSAKDNPVKVYSWRGLTPHMGATIICFDEDCPQKSLDSDPDDSGDSDEDSSEMCCIETYKRMGYGFGPRMYTFTVTWTARKLKPEDGDDPTILGTDELQAQWLEVYRDSLAP